MDQQQLWELVKKKKVWEGYYFVLVACGFQWKQNSSFWFIKTPKVPILEKKIPWTSSFRKPDEQEVKDNYYFWLVLGGF